MIHQKPITVLMINLKALAIMLLLVFYSLYVLYIYIVREWLFLSRSNDKSKFKKKKKKQLCRNSFWPDTTHGMELCHCLSVEQVFCFFLKLAYCRTHSPGPMLEYHLHTEKVIFNSPPTPGTKYVCLWR